MESVFLHNVKFPFIEQLPHHSTLTGAVIFFSQTVLPHTYINVSIQKHCFHTLHLQTAILNHIYKKRAIANATALWLPLLDSNQRPFG